MYTSTLHFTFIRKVILINITGLFTMTSALSQPCTICSQADVDNFTGDLQGNVVIKGPDITNLDALSDNIGGFFLGFHSLTITDNPVLTDISGISLLQNLSQAEVNISENLLLETISLPLLLSAQYSFDIVNNSSLDSISLPKLTVGNLNIENNDSLKYIELTGNTTLANLTISNNTTLENLDGMAEFINFNTLIISNNSQLRFYCALHAIILGDPAADITITGNLKIPTFEEILLEGTCGNYVRNLIGYETLSDALDGANDHDFIFVERDNKVEISTIFSGIQNHTIVIRPSTTLTFDASFTNEGIVINHGTLEMLTGSLFTNAGAFVNTGTLIAN